MTENPTSSGKAKGGFARAESLTPERRSEIARAAAQKRWESPRKPKETSKERRDKLNVEVLAVALYESACRAYAGRSETAIIFSWTGVPDWASLAKEDRNTWRLKAREMISEQ